MLSFEYNTGLYNGVFSLADAYVAFRNGFQVKFIGNCGQESGVILVTKSSQLDFYGSDNKHYCNTAKSDGL